MDPAVVIVGDRREDRELLEGSRTGRWERGGAAAQVVVGQPRGRVLLREHAPGERHLELGCVGAADGGTMVVDPVDVRALLRKLGQMLAGRGRVPREVGDPDLVVLAAGAEFELLEHAVAVVVGDQPGDHSLPLVKARNRGRRHYPVEAGRTVTDDLNRAPCGWLTHRGKNPMASDQS